MLVTYRTVSRCQLCNSAVAMQRYVVNMFALYILNNSSCEATHAGHRTDFVSRICHMCVHGFRWFRGVSEWRRHCVQPLVCLCLLQLCICGYPIATGAASRLVSGYDSYGNTCGWNNSKIEGVPLSGLDMREKKLVPLSLVYSMSIINFCLFGSPYFQYVLPFLLI